MPRHKNSRQTAIKITVESNSAAYAGKRRFAVFIAPIKDDIFQANGAKKYA